METFFERRDRLRQMYGRERVVPRETPSTDVAPEPPPAEIASSLDVEQAFVTEIHGKTILTAPATTQVEKAATDHGLMLWLNGRFVGGEEANRNKAFWSTSDLELGEPTVKHGPLNWLHEDHHIVGTIAEAALVTTEARPYIEAASAVWRWLWPNEARVMEMAAEQNQLWYSMECISKEVACLADGCGSVTDFLPAHLKQPPACEHVRERSSVRRFVEPTFLGGAAIVPPVRPGWADAHVGLMKRAAPLAEAAFEQAGNPSVEASRWERLMAEVVRYAELP